MMTRLDIFVSAHCFGCQEARRLAGAVAERFQAVSVRLVDLDAEPEARPARVIAVPAYLLDDTVISFGNPRQAELFQQVERAVAAEQVGRW
jgi:hypothetical protein